MTESVEYIQLIPETPLPEITFLSPFRAVVIDETAVSTEWQSLVSDWLVHSGCLYMMAWGINCSSWDDSVDMANMDQFGFDEIPDDNFVMTTWHDDEPLEEVFWFSKNNAIHPTIMISHTVLLDISPSNRQSEIMRAYVDA
jgi:hypothetical protein